MFSLGGGRRLFCRERRQEKKRHGNEIIVGNLGDQQVVKYGLREEFVEEGKLRLDSEYLREKRKCPDTDMRIYPTGSKKLVSDFKQ